MIVWRRFQYLQLLLLLLPADNSPTFVYDANAAFKAKSYSWSFRAPSASSLCRSLPLRFLCVQYQLKQRSLLSRTLIDMLSYKNFTTLPLNCHTLYQLPVKQMSLLASRTARALLFYLAMILGKLLSTPSSIAQSGSGKRHVKSLHSSDEVPWVWTASARGSKPACLILIFNHNC